MTDKKVSMKFAKLLHNAGAGNGEHSINDIAAIIRNAGFECVSESAKEVDEEDITTCETDFLVLAGGDGTVRKIAKHLLREALPIALLPMGTANNIAHTLGVADLDTNSIVESWRNADIKKFDIGRVYGLGKRRFFIEGVGYGVFPLLMKEMKRQKKNVIDDPTLRLQTAVELLHDIVQTFEAKNCTLKIDGIEYSGKFLLAEVMNIRSIGPNLNLAPFADPGDGWFEVVLIPEQKRSEFLRYLETKVHGNERLTFFHTVPANHVEMHWKGRSMHIDDEVTRLEKSQPVTIELQKNALKFLVPASS